LRQNPRFNETNSGNKINFRNLPNNHNTLQDILYTSIRETNLRNELAKRTCSIDEIKKIEKFLSIYQILIVSSKNHFEK
jgi:hypothetical protein